MGQAGQAATAVGLLTFDDANKATGSCAAGHQSRAYLAQRTLPAWIPGRSLQSDACRSSRASFSTTCTGGVRESSDQRRRHRHCFDLQLRVRRGRAVGSDARLSSSKPGRAGVSRSAPAMPAVTCHSRQQRAFKLRNCRPARSLERSSHATISRPSPRWSRQATCRPAAADAAARSEGRRPQTFGRPPFVSRDDPDYRPVQWVSGRSSRQETGSVRIINVLIRFGTANRNGRDQLHGLCRR